MKAYHGNPAIKEQFLTRVRAHQAADQLVQGYGYWRDGKGCAVGCTIHTESEPHKAYERELGIPERIAYLEDRLFERLPKEPARTWPERFLNAIPVGADLSQVWDQFMHWLLVDGEHGVIKYAKSERAKKAIQAVADLYARKIAGEKIATDDWRVARKEAWEVYHESWEAAEAEAAAAAAAAEAAEAAAAAAAAAFGTDRYWEVHKQAMLRMSEKLLELLRNAPVAETATA